MPIRHSRSRYLAAVAVLLAPQPLGAQGLPVPSAHFGALAFPTPDRVWEAGLVSDRFTEFTKAQDEETGDASRNRHYALRTTLGINLAYLTRSFHWRERATVFRAGAFVGRAGDQPSRWLQNDFRHRDLGLDTVRVGHVTTGQISGGVVAVDTWRDLAFPLGDRRKLVVALFGGLDGMVSNLYDEVAFSLGTRIATYPSGRIPSVGLGYRKGVYVNPRQILTRAPRDPAASSMADVIANTYSASTASLRLPVDEWTSSHALIPAIEVGFSGHSGFFLSKDPDSTKFERQAEKFMTIAAQWGKGDFAIETYNDAPGDKDIGPTFGIRTYLRWRTWWWER